MSSYDMTKYDMNTANIGENKIVLLIFIFEEWENCMGCGKL